MQERDVVRRTFCGDATTHQQTIVSYAQFSTQKVAKKPPIGHTVEKCQHPLGISVGPQWMFQQLQGFLKFPTPRQVGDKFGAAISVADPGHYRPRPLTLNSKRSQPPPPLVSPPAREGDSAALPSIYKHFHRPPPLAPTASCAHTGCTATAYVIVNGAGPVKYRPLSSAREGEGEFYHELPFHLATHTPHSRSTLTYPTGVQHTVCGWGGKDEVGLWSVGEANAAVNTGEQEDGNGREEGEGMSAFTHLMI
ncbi:hypothetical protein B0H13DRAFT_1850677 [Mycena leptocephala]|nr:hypothetical protein B0H13DRAFT_1850677 [Mycena leptocephala]